jgi:hypothetical protein
MFPTLIHNRRQCQQKSLGGIYSKERIDITIDYSAKFALASLRILA